MRLRTKFLGLALPVLLLCFTIGTFLILEKEKEDFIDQGKEKASLFASSIEKALQDDMLEGRPDIIIRLLNELRKMEDIYELEILKEDGSRAFEPGFLRIDSTTASAMKEEKDASFMRDIGGRKSLTLFRPLINEQRCQLCHKDGKRIRGFFLISTSMEEAYKKIDINRKWMVIFSLILLLSIGILSALFIRRILLKPISILTEDAKTLGTGNLDHRIKISGKDELHDLANAFNDMAGRLKESYSSLEDKMAERTKELALLSFELDQIAKLSTSVFRGNLSLKEIFISFIDVIVHSLGYYGAALYLIDKEDKALKAEHYKRLGLGEEDLPKVVSLDGSHFLTDIALEGKTTILDTNPWFRKEGSTLALLPILSRVGRRCWEEFGCPCVECPAYGNPDLRCWLIPETLCCSIVWEKTERGKPPEEPKVDRCVLCPEFSVMGILGVASLTTFSQDSLYTLEILTSEIAAAVENANLIDKIKKDKSLIEGVILSMNSGLLLLDMNGIIQRINLVGSEILKGTIKELTGASILERFPGSEGFMKVSSNLGREFNFKVMDGSIVPIGFSNSYLYSASGEPEGIIIIFRDLTEIRALQKEFREKERFATIGRVAAGVAHEIRNPLSGISSVAQILKKELTGTTTHKELIDAMLSEINRLNSLIKELLIYSKPISLNIKEVEIFELVNEVVSLQMYVSGNCRISIKGDLGVPPIKIDPERIKQVLLNILRNAVDATSASGNIDITIERPAGTESLLIKVSDDGLGISEEEIERVFDLFYTTKEKGTGLGLPICRKIMDDHGGSIEIKSKTGKGTTVILRFPS